MSHLRLFKFTALLIAFFWAQLSQADDAAAKTNYVYLNKGELVSGWELSVGDPGKWYTPISDRTGKSASNKVSVSPTDFRAHNDAI